MAAASFVLDSSAVIALVKGEKGWHRVAEVLAASVILSVNAAEVYSKIAEWEMPEDLKDKYHAVMEDLIVPYDMDLAIRTGVLRGKTSAEGLSLGDRACLSLAQRLGVPALTSDQIWSKVQVGVKIELIR